MFRSLTSSPAESHLGLFDVFLYGFKGLGGLWVLVGVVGVKIQSISLSQLMGMLERGWNRLFFSPGGGGGVGEAGGEAPASSSGI